MWIILGHGTKGCIECRKTSVLAPLDFKVGKYDAYYYLMPGKGTDTDGKVVSKKGNEQHVDHPTGLGPMNMRKSRVPIVLKITFYRPRLFITKQDR